MPTPFGNGAGCERRVCYFGDAEYLRCGRAADGVIRGRGGAEIEMSANKLPGDVWKSAPSRFRTQQNGV